MELWIRCVASLYTLHLWLSAAGLVCFLLSLLSFCVVTFSVATRNARFSVKNVRASMAKWKHRAARLVIFESRSRRSLPVPDYLSQNIQPDRVRQSAVR